MAFFSDIITLHFQPYREFNEDIDSFFIFFWGVGGCAGIRYRSDITKNLVVYEFNNEYIGSKQ